MKQIKCKKCGVPISRYVSKHYAGWCGYCWKIFQTNLKDFLGGQNAN